MRYMLDNHGLKSDQDIITIVDYAFSGVGYDGWFDVAPCDESGMPSLKYRGFSIHVTTLFGRPAVCVYGWDSCARDFCRHLDCAVSAGNCWHDFLVAYCDCNRADSIGF